jgi:hypothetical protein
MRNKEQRACVVTYRGDAPTCDISHRLDDASPLLEPGAASLLVTVAVVAEVVVVVCAPTASHRSGWGPVAV